MDFCYTKNSLCSTTAVRRMGLTAAPSLSNTLPATPAVSLAWMGRSSPRCPCHHQSRLDPPTPRNLQGGDAATALPAPPMTPPSTSVPLMRCAMAVSASPTCPRTMRTRRWRCRCPPSEAPCWGTPSVAGHPISIPTPEPSAPKCDHPKPPQHHHPYVLHTHTPLLTYTHTTAPPLTKP